MIEVTNELVKGILIENDFDELDGFWTVSELTENMREFTDYLTMEDVIKIISSLNKLYCTIREYGYIQAFPYEMCIELEIDVFIQDWYDYLMQVVDDGYQVDIIYHATNEKDYLWGDNVYFEALTATETEIEAQKAFEYMEKQKIIEIALYLYGDDENE